MAESLGCPWDLNTNGRCAARSCANFSLIELMFVSMQETPWKRDQVFSALGAQTLELRWGASESIWADRVASEQPLVSRGSDHPDGSRPQPRQGT